MVGCRQQRRRSKTRRLQQRRRLMVGCRQQRRRSKTRRLQQRRRSAGAMAMMAAACETVEETRVGLHCQELPRSLLVCTYELPTCCAGRTRRRRKKHY